MDDNLKVYAADIEKRGRSHGHKLGMWAEAEIDLDHVPPKLALRGVVRRSVQPRIECARCDAWAAFVTADGIHCNSPAFDQPCPGPERPRAA